MTIAKSSMTMKSIEILGPMKSSYEEILTPDALSFLQYLHQNFNARRLIQTAINQGKFPNFPEETKIIREDLTWKGAIPAPGLIDRRVEITGPVDRKMIINALNSGATQFMADLEG
jgi:malate synthase